MTMHGKSRTNPSGIDILEFPFNRILLRKNANLERTRLFSSLKSFSEGILGVEGSCFDICCTHPISNAFEVVGIFLVDPAEGRELGLRLPPQVINPRTRLLIDTK